MTTMYNVHLYREMRLYFPGIEACSHGEAARFASGKASNEAAYIEDREGDTLAALVDVEGDAEFAESRTIDFEPARLQKAAPVMLAALDAVRLALRHYRHWLPTMPKHEADTQCCEVCAMRDPDDPDYDPHLGDYDPEQYRR